ncbi:uncharacterized protein LOC119582222 [Penaeus monodon]|uniref:uncharacterized protein LOC119582222 n=1 Tax=Penaeus monodon TaxID=6687 RepID=UPI0018A76BE7|nr:uncharacterized protein LOC119582222 [Penaeus monodon]
MILWKQTSPIYLWLARSVWCQQQGVPECGVGEGAAQDTPREPLYDYRRAHTRPPLGDNVTPVPSSRGTTSHSLRGCQLIKRHLKNGQENFSQDTHQRYTVNKRANKPRTYTGVFAVLLNFLMRTDQRNKKLKHELS